MMKQESGIRNWFGIVLASCFLLLASTTHAQSVDIVWQGETYTPPLYKGLPLWTNESRVTFVAIPQDIPNASSLIYRWKKDGVVLGPNSGVNKKSISFNDSVLSLPIEMEVDLFVEEGLAPVASGKLALKPTQAKTLVVEDNALYGLLLNKSIKNSFELTEDETSFVGLPLFVDVSTRLAPAITYTWSTNTGDSRSNNSVTYRSPDAGQGSASVTLRIKNANSINQPNPINFLIKFNKQESL